MMTWNEVMELFGNPDYAGIRTDFSIIRQILAIPGSPQEKLRFIHVAGTNGKGSASRMMQKILTESGYKTGLYISPHLEYMNERWSVDDVLITDEEIIHIAGTVNASVQKYNTQIRHHSAEIGESSSCSSSLNQNSMENRLIQPTAFELLTMMAFVWFAEQHCDIVILEVGIGGRLDATNVIPAPECALIMNIGLEHTELLGHTLEEIALQKGGIIKNRVDVVLYHQTAAVETVIQEICRQRQANLHITDPEKVVVYNHTVFSYKDHLHIDLNLTGSFQRQNALVVLDAADVLRNKGWDIPEESVHKALASVTWPGRFEIVSTDPPVIVDGAHNPNGIAALVDAIREQQRTPLLEGRKLIFIVGIMADKDVDSMLRLLAPFASGFVMEAPDNERADAPADLKTKVQQYFHGEVHTVPSIRQAVQLALSIADFSADPCAIICCGSLFQVSEIRRLFQGT